MAPFLFNYPFNNALTRRFTPPFSSISYTWFNLHYFHGIYEHQFSTLFIFHFPDACNRKQTSTIEMASSFQNIPLMVYLTFVLSFFVFGPVYGRETLKGLQCIDHPVYKRSKFQGEIIRSWRYTQMKKHIHYFSDSGYIPRYKQHTWAPTSDQSSRKYEKLDFFATYMQKKGPKIYLHLYFQRPAKVYIFVGGRFDKTLPRVSLPGWKSEGWASMSKGDASERAHVGLMNTKDFPVSQHAYVFSKLSTDNSIAMPSMMWVSANVRGYKSNGYYFALIRAIGAHTNTSTDLRRRN